MSGGGDVYCPHCFTLVASGVSGAWPATHARCPQCALIIGPGRGRPSPDGNPGARGAAAGVMAERARRAAPTPTHSKADVRAALGRVAAEMGLRIERLLMVDYQDRAAHDPSLPQLPEVLALYGGWKAARRDAAERARADG